MSPWRIASFVIALAAAMPALADQVLLVGGGRVEGEILEEGAEAIRIRSTHGILSIPRDRVLSIVRKDYRPEPPPAPPAPPVPEPPPVPASAPDAPPVPAPLPTPTVDPAELAARVATLVNDLDIEGENEQSDTAMAELVKLGAPGLPALAAALQDAPPLAASRLCTVLGRIGGAGVEKILAAQLRSPHGEVKAAASLALAGFPTAWKEVAALLADGDWTVRRDAAQALSGMKANEAAPALIDRLSDVNLHVRAAAHEALKALTGADAGGEPAPWKAWLEAHPGFLKPAP